MPAAVQEPTQDFAVELDQTLRVLDRLSPKHREIITMICVKEFSYERTAELLDIPIGTVRSRLSRARLELQSVIEGGRGGDGAPQRPASGIRPDDRLAA